MSWLKKVDSHEPPSGAVSRSCFAEPSVSAKYLPSIAAMSAGFEGWDEDLLEACRTAETMFRLRTTCLRKKQDTNRRAEAVLRFKDTCLRRVPTPQNGRNEKLGETFATTSLHAIMSLYEKIVLKGKNRL